MLWRRAKLPCSMSSSLYGMNLIHSQRRFWWKAGFWNHRAIYILTEKSAAGTWIRHNISDGCIQVGWEHVQGWTSFTQQSFSNQLCCALGATCNMSPGKFEFTCVSCSKSGYGGFTNWFQWSMSCSCLLAVPWWTSRYLQEHRVWHVMLWSTYARSVIPFKLNSCHNTKFKQNRRNRYMINSLIGLRFSARVLGRAGLV